MSCGCKHDDWNRGHHRKHGRRDGHGHSRRGCGCRCRCHCRSGCDCREGHGGFRRRFVSRAERIEELERYLENLEAEATAVREQIADLNKPG